MSLFLAQALRRHLAQAAGAPAPAVAAGGPVLDYGACGGAGVIAADSSLVVLLLTSHSMCGKT